MADEQILIDVDARGTARITLNRPQRHNAFDDGLIAALTQALQDLGASAAVRSVVIAAKGRSFSAGADLGWMRRMAAASFDDNVADARRLAGLLRVLDTLPKPTLAMVQGPAYGGGVGLVAACDIVIAARETARFALTEVRLGLAPATISPYVIAAVGIRQARRFMLTAETFDAEEALRVGLVHVVVAAADLEARTQAVLDDLAAAGPQALAACKAVAAAVAGRPVDDDLMEHTAQTIARLRAGDEARSRIAAFLAKRT